ncbi:MAG: lactate utilization protein C [Acidobacteriota bacterium]
MERADVLRKMQEKAEAVQTIVAQVKSLEEAFQYTVALTLKQGGATLAAPTLGEQDRASLEGICAESGIRLLDGNLRAHMKEIHTAFTPVECGIAETGTVVVDSTSENVRLATMLSETHVALVPASRIYPDAMSIESDLRERMLAPPRYMAFISGASRTADIERVLTIGVHGPQELHILIMEETE